MFRGNDLFELKFLAKNIIRKTKIEQTLGQVNTD
jgi:hypothetical protein